MSKGPEKHPCGADTPVREDFRPVAKGEQECSAIDFSIRPATPDDVPAILTLERDTPSAAHWPASAYQRIFMQDAPARVAFVIEDSSHALYGFGIGCFASGDCELENLVVAPPQQRRGLGSRLLRELIAAAQARAAARMFLEVRESNSPARALYEKFGFAATGRRPAYYADLTEDAILYTLQL